MELQERLVFFIVRLPFFLVAIGLHEAAHAWAAYKSGDPTAKNMGRLTLNPMAHVDPVGFVFFFISAMAGVGFGWAKPVPVNPSFFRNPRRDEIFVSIAGVGANFIQMILAIALIKALVVSGVISMENTGHGVGGSLNNWIMSLSFWFMFFNCVLMVFNLLPIPPLDGSKILMMLLPRRQAAALATLEPYGFVIVMLLLFTGVINTIINYTIGILMWLMGYIL